MMRSSQMDTWRRSLSNPLGLRITAFSLIELLVVVAIIALLAAILLPSLRKARSQTRRVSCQANLKQIAIGWHAYLEESRGRFPQYQRSNITWGGMKGKVDPLYQVRRPVNRNLGLDLIVRDAKTFACPSDAGTLLYKPTCWQWVGNSYMTNPMMVGDPALVLIPFDPCNQPPSSTTTLIRKLNSRIPKLTTGRVTTNPSHLLFFGDFGWTNAWNFQTGLDRAEWHDQRYGYNLAYYDGHAEFVRIHKGLHVTSRYAVIPFQDLTGEASDCQQETDK